MEMLLQSLIGIAVIVDGHGYMQLRGGQCQYLHESVCKRQGSTVAKKETAKIEGNVYTKVFHGYVTEPLLRYGSELRTEIDEEGYTVIEAPIYMYK